MTDKPAQKRKRSVASAPSPVDGLSQSAISDVDYRLIGLSPQYWSYTPLLIGDLVGLPLINGVDCFVGNVGSGVLDDDDTVDTNKSSQHIDTDENTDRHGPQNDKQKVDDNGSWHIIPLSRVLLRGIVTTIDRRPNGCTLIVLDDGTGSIDCRYWDSSGNDAFNLPPLLSEHATINNKRRGFRFVVGDSLEVMGKIKTMTAGTSTNDKCKLSNRSATPMEVRFGCVREVHASSACLIGEGQTRMANQWNGEVVHWLKCVKFSRMAGGSKSNASFDDDKKSSCTIRNGKDVLPLLGETISSSILSEESIGFSNFDSNTIGNGSVLKRKCCQTPYRFRSALFYCHCEATLEVLDSSFRFRDALLNRLLDMEARLQRSSESFFPSVTEDCMDLFGTPSDHATPPPLLFTFESIYKDGKLASIASETVALTALPEANAQRLFRKTFAAMTNDGILSLYDARGDLYLLVSRTRVIEPFLRNAYGGDFRAGQSIPQPFFIKSVPRKRVADIKSWIESTDGII